MCKKRIGYLNEFLPKCSYLLFDVKARVNDRYGVKYYKEATLFRECTAPKS